VGCSDVLAGPHEQGIGFIGTMGIGPDPPMLPMRYGNHRLVGPDGARTLQVGPTAGIRGSGRKPRASTSATMNPQLRLPIEG
jgi:hypothetical protein